MKIGAMVPQGWRMDLHGIEPNHQWNAILESSATNIVVPSSSSFFISRLGLISNTLIILFL